MKGFTVTAFLFALGIGVVVSVDWDTITVLDQYVHKDDGHFHYEEVLSYNLPGVTVYVVNMTSQLWQTAEYSTRPIWWHYVCVTIPDKIDFPDAGLLVIESGYNTNSDPPERTDATLVIVAGLAVDTGIISAYIKFVPNQPVQFYDDPNFEGRTEDRVIAWTWRSFLDSPEPSDPTVILRMPMTKAAKRGLDTMALVASQRRPETNLTQFIISGASKRGWTTYSLAATDRRVVAQIPMVFSLINIENGTLHNHNRDMDGGWSFEFRPYWRENLTTDLIFNPKAQGIYEVEDMLYFMERFTIPTLAISASGDEFFLVDENHYWWDKIPGPHFLMMLPNAEHAMAPHYVQLYETAVSFIHSVFLNVPFPKVSWNMGETETGGYITFFTDPPPVRIKAFVAHSLSANGRRDFRLRAHTNGENHVQQILWRQTLNIIERGNGEYYVEAQKVENEWVGFFFEGEWEGPSGRRMVFTSQVNVIPNTYPRAQCTTPEECYGTLV
jgi:PhoPQ-activated pathogenicity-related protein